MTFLDFLSLVPKSIHQGILIHEGLQSEASATIDICSSVQVEPDCKTINDTGVQVFTNISVVGLHTRLSDIFQSPLGSGRTETIRSHLQNESNISSNVCFIKHQLIKRIHLSPIQLSLEYCLSAFQCCNISSVLVNSDLINDSRSASLA